MDNSIPLRPRDVQLTNVIDKLAEFVARNGKEFEQMTRIKQENNPTFAFLYPGSDYHNYYRYRVEEERRYHSNEVNNQPQQNIWSGNNNNNNNNVNNTNQLPQNNNVNITAQKEAINVQQMALREQIRQSELNLGSQHQVLLQQQKNQIEEAIANAQSQNLMKLSCENHVSLAELDEILQPILASCTKQDISNGANEDENDKLSKLLSLWASKANFFDSCAISKLRSPPSSLQEYQNSLLTQYASVITPLTQATKATFDSYQKQHQAFIQHAANQIALLDSQKQQLDQMKPQPLLPEMTQNSQQIPSLVNMMMNNPQNRNDNNSSLMGNIFNNNSNNNNNNNGNNYSQQNQSQQYHIQPEIQQQQQQQQQQMRGDFSLPPPTFPSIPDLSRPPPGFNQSSAENSPPPVIEVEEIQQPLLPYFELPAGLMVPLIRLEDYNYRGLDTELIRLPPPTPPNDRLLSAVEAFYSAPSHERPRDGEGWEKLGLYEYFKIKNSARKQKEEGLSKGDRERSKSPSPIPESFIKLPKKQKRREYRSKSRSQSRSRSPSRSMSPQEPRVMMSNKNNMMQSNNNRQSRKKSESPPQRNFNRDSRTERRKRSVTPPSFMGGAANKAANEFIDEKNKGHQLLKKLGWKKGGGLGSSLQGTAVPIPAGELREKHELYKGIGVGTVSADPYESFRKNKGQTFIARMKARSDDKV